CKTPCQQLLGGFSRARKNPVFTLRQAQGERGGSGNQCSLSVRAEPVEHENPFFSTLLVAEFDCEVSRRNYSVPCNPIGRQLQAELLINDGRINTLAGLLRSVWRSK